ncbi:aldo/keto reductase [Cerasicoccus arenae]|uniref:Oxidoreductase n=1 Tax=Cerasicoccus arenae TaxID=424488 RepID=A0A8J3DCZ4_9BACT|nr:aldo/keto reductase [Cerasicoccus arenae]MBK1858788.1 aldo/keto reductase [Cerasicoccus arenae]GHC04571.1 oxidoreductase [Cerasicoccus arenae]
MNTLASPPPSTKISNWGVIGPGRIAHKFAKGLAETDGVLYAAASRDVSRAQAFLDEYGGGQAYSDYQAMLDDPQVDAVYIATPHPLHAQWAIKAAKAGKHVLCEKPATLNYGEAMAVVDAAQMSGVAFLEAFMYRCHPSTAKVYELVASGAIGQVQRIRASFAFDSGEDFEGRHQANSLGGGGILDVGCYPVSMCRLLAGAAHGKRFLDPIQLKGMGHLDATTGVDTWASAIMKFEGDIIGEAFTGVRAGAENDVTVYGTGGTIILRDPWFCGGEIILHRKGKDPETIDASSSRHLYAFEVEALVQIAAKGEAPGCAMTIADTLGNMRTLDQWRAELGFLYDSEKPTPSFPCVHGGGLAPRGQQIPSETIPGLDKPASRLVMGHPGPRPFTEVAPLYDDYFERGGNCFDDGAIYRGWAVRPSCAGQWMVMRGVREQCILLDKGAHSPYCWPQVMLPELDRMLHTAGTGYIDVYMMHRDNLEVPVGEFVDVMNRMVASGHVRVYGMSNWTLERMDEAIAYAEQNGLRPPACLSNQLSLAEMVNPVWEGTASCSNPEDQAWLKAREMTLIPWSSQAAGFFTDLSAPDRHDIPLLEYGYYSEANFERKKRTYQLAAEKNVLPINIALAWVLAQPFPTFPIIGPRSLTETRTALAGLELNLTPRELDWLNLKADK